MDIKDLNKSQLILLAILLSFVVSIATGITTVTLMEQAPNSVTVPITRIVRETVEKVAPAAADTRSNAPALSDDEKKLLEDLKAIKPLTVTLYLKGDTEAADKVLGTGLFLGDNKVVIASLVTAPADGQTYVVKSVLGEQNIVKLTQEKDFTVVELAQTATPADPSNASPSDTSSTGDAAGGAAQ
ncbi:MAG: hypothetical protein WDN09_03760 [bacterium]